MRRKEKSDRENKRWRKSIESERTARDNNKKSHNQYEKKREQMRDIEKIKLIERRKESERERDRDRYYRKIQRKREIRKRVCRESESRTKP